MAAEAEGVADHAAAQRQHMAPAVQAGRDEIAVDSRHGGQRLVLLAIRHGDQGGVGQTSRKRRGDCVREVVAAAHGHASAEIPLPRQALALLQQAGFDDDVIAAAGAAYRDARHSSTTPCATDCGVLSSVGNWCGMSR